MSGSRVIVMGPSGSGKSLIGALLAQRLDVPFADADDLHPTANIAKMARGAPLDDRDRLPWLDRVGDALATTSSGVVIACSALARRYRDQIRTHTPDAVFVELLTPPTELARRMGVRDHFMPPALLASQLDALEHLEPDERGGAVANVSTPETVMGLAYDLVSRV